jgi:hypothetical protein
VPGLRAQVDDAGGELTWNRRSSALATGLRAVERGDAAAQERALSWLRRGAAEQEHYDAAVMAELENGQALAGLARIYRRDQPIG